jgi:hypothetical protein
MLKGMDILVSLGSIFEGRENVGVGSTFNSVNEGRNLREEGIVVLSISTIRVKGQEDIQ